MCIFFILKNNTNHFLFKRINYSQFLGKVGYYFSFSGNPDIAFSNLLSKSITSSIPISSH